MSIEQQSKTMQQCTMISNCADVQISISWILPPRNGRKRVGSVKTVREGLIQFQGVEKKSYKFTKLLN